MRDAYHCHDLEHGYGQDVADLIDSLTVDDLLHAAALVEPHDLANRARWVRDQADACDLHHPLRARWEQALRILRTG